MGDELIQRYLSDLDAALAVVPASARSRAAIVAEIGDGLADAVADHLDRGHLPDQATGRAIEEFGAATVLAAQFVPILATAQVHRWALVLLRTGPLVGALWLVTGLLAVSRGLPIGWPVVGILIGVVLVVSVPCTVVAVVVTGRGSHRWPLRPRQAADAARLAAGGAILGDLVLLIALSIQASPVLTAPDGGLAGAAMLASLIRLTLATRGATRLRRARALLG